MYTMLNLEKSGSLLGLHLQLRVHGQYNSQLSVHHCTIQLHSTLQGIFSLFINTFQILTILSQCSTFHIFFGSSYTHYDWQNFIFHISSEATTTVITTKLRLPCDMIGCEICCGRSHAGDHTLSCTGQGG